MCMSIFVFALGSGALYKKGTEIEICSNHKGVEIFYLEMRTENTVKLTITYNDRKPVYKVSYANRTETTIWIVVKIIYLFKPTFN